MFVINGTPVSREKKLFNKYIEGIPLHFLLNKSMSCYLRVNSSLASWGDILRSIIEHAQLDGVSFISLIFNALPN